MNSKLNSGLKESIRSILGRAMDLVPDSIWLRLLRLRWKVLSSRDSDDALRLLLRADSDINLYIDREAIRYDGGTHAKHRLTRYHDFFVDRIGPDDKALDAGCGMGEVAFDIADRTGAHVLAMDLNPDKIAQAKERFAHPLVEYRVGDILKGDAGGPFDVVVLSNTLEHLPNRPEFLARLVKDGRPRLLVRVPLFERDWKTPLRRELGLEWRSDPTHETEYTLETFKAEIEGAGLVVAHQEVRWGEIWAELRPPSRPGE